MDVGLLSGLANALTLANIGFALIGCLLGTLVGILPGLGPASAMAILLPVALYLPADGAIIIMAGIYYGAMYGGSTTAILMNIPGEVASVITAQDGFAMTKQGRAGEALAIAAIGSYLAGMLGTLAIAFLGPMVADLALHFGPPEYFGLVLFSMTTLVSFAGRSVMAGVMLGVFGMWLASVGTDPLTGTQRLNFGTLELMKGFDIVPVLIGLFGIAEVLASLEQRVEQIYGGKLGSVWSMIPRGAEMTRGLAASMRGTVIGFVFGLLPGMLPALTAYLSYDVERQISRTPEKFGTGMIEGVAAPEAANNATAMAGFIPLLSLGIPTTPALAILLGTLMINGLTPGTDAVPAAAPAGVDRDRLDVHRQHRAADPQPAAGGPVGAHQPRALSRARAHRARRLRGGRLCAAQHHVRRVGGDRLRLVGYAMRRLSMPLAPLVLGFLLGPLFEQSLRQSIALQGTPAIFFTRPIPLALIVGAVLVLGVTLWLRRRSREVSQFIRDSTNES